MEFQIVTPRTLGTFSGKALILADVKCIGNEEVQALTSYAKSGGWLLITGETAHYDDLHRVWNPNPLDELLGITDPSKNKHPTQV